MKYVRRQLIIHKRRMGVGLCLQIFGDKCWIERGGRFFVVCLALEGGMRLECQGTAMLGWRHELMPTSKSPTVKMSTK
jgi:hypothetical protein